MATFPSLKPAARRVKLGLFPVTTEQGYGGGSVRFIHGPFSSSQVIELTFTNLTDAKVDLIREHYRTQQGGFLSFELPSEVTAGASYFSSVAETSVFWKYADIPAETHKLGNVYDVTVTLEAVA